MIDSFDDGLAAKNKNAAVTECTRILNDWSPILRGSVSYSSILTDVGVLRRQFNRTVGGLMRDLARGSSPFGSTLSTLQQAHDEAQSAPLSMLSYKNMFDKAMESLELIYPGFASGDYSMKTTVVYDGYSHVLYDSVLRFIEKFNPDSDAIKPLSSLPSDDMSHPLRS